MEWIQATSRPCHHNRFPIRLVRRPLPSGTPPSLEQTSQPRTTLMNWRCAVLVRIFAGLTCPVVTRYQDIIGTSLGTEARRARVASRWLGRPRQSKLLFQNLGERTYNGQIYTARSRPAEVRAIQASFPAQCRYRGGQPPIFRVSC